MQKNGATQFSERSLERFLCSLTDIAAQMAKSHYAETT